MASSRRRKGNRLAIPEKTPGFFKVVLNEALQDGRLEIEGFVAIKYRNFLARSILLKVPNGEIWPVKLTRSDGSTWLQKGWLELADFYSLEQGYFLFFSYEANTYILCQQIYLHKRPDLKCGPSSSIWGNLVCREQCQDIWERWRACKNPWRLEEICTRQSSTSRGCSCD